MVAFRAAASNSGTGVASLVVNVPTGTVNGDVLLLFGTNTAGNTYTTPTGWTLLDSTNAGTDGLSSSFWRIASSEPASYTLTKSDSIQSSAAAMVCYSGATSTPIRDHKSSTADHVTTGAPTALVGVIATDMAVHFYGVDEDTASTTNLAITPPGGSWNTRVSVSLAKAGASTPGSAIAAIDQLGSSATPSTTSGAQSAFVICSVALISAAIPVSPTGIASAGAFGTTVVTVGQTVSPTGTATGEAFGTTAVTVQIPVFPTGIATAGALGTPTVAAGTPLSASGTIRRFDSLTRVVRDTRTQSEDDAATALARLGTHTHSTAPNGLTVTGPTVLASYTTTGRPSASTSGAGATVYDTTLSKPVFSDGFVWRDAAGTVV